MHTKALLSFVALLSFASVSFGSVAEAEVKIATVDVARIVNENPDALAKKKDLDSFSEETKKKLEAKGKELQALKKKLEDSKVSPDSKEAENFRNQVRDFERMRGDAKTDLEKRYMKVNKELTEKIYSQIEKYAKANNYDLIIDKSDKYRGPILYGDSSTDVTDDVLKMVK
jgi:outer membrane protein